MTLVLLLAGPVLATPGPPVPVAAVLDADCAEVRQLAEGEAVRLSLQRQAVACEPGGPCERILDEPLSARRLELWSEACGAPVPGRFSRTSDRCGDHPVWRWSAPLPPGRYHVRDWPDTLVSFEVAGEKAPCAHPREEGPVRRVDAERERARAFISPRALDVQDRPEGGWLVVLDPGAAGLGHLCAADERPSAVVEGPSRAEHVLAGLVVDEAGRVEVRVDRESWTEQRDIRAGRHRECEVARHHRLTVVLSGPELTFSCGVAPAPRTLPHPCAEVP